MITTLSRHRCRAQTAHTLLKHDDLAHVTQISTTPFRNEAPFVQRLDTAMCCSTAAPSEKELMPTVIWGAHLPVPQLLLLWLGLQTLRAGMSPPSSALLKADNGADECDRQRHDQHHRQDDRQHPVVVRPIKLVPAARAPSPHCGLAWMCYTVKASSTGRRLVVPGEGCDMFDNTATECDQQQICCWSAAARDSQQHLATQLEVDG